MTDRKCSGEDVMHLGPQVDADGSRVCVRHTADHQIQTGILKPLKDGQPLGQGMSCLALSRRDDGSFDVDELYQQEGASVPEGTGPAMVNSEQFKNGWDRIFGKTTVGVA